MDIAALLLWFVTAGAGLYLLLAGRPGAAAASAGEEAAAAPTPATVPPSPVQTAPVQTAPVQAGLPQATVDALAAGAKVPPITHTRVKPPPGQHPLLEFMHPALGVIGLGCWLAYVATQFAAFAWMAFGVLVATIAAGLTWYTINRRSAVRATHSPPAGRRIPPRRILIHGGAAGTTLILALITLLVSVNG